MRQRSAVSFRPVLRFWGLLGALLLVCSVTDAAWAVERSSDRELSDRESSNGESSDRESSDREQSAGVKSTASKTMKRTHGRAGGSRGCAIAAPGGGGILLAAKPALVLLGMEEMALLPDQSQAARPLFAWYVRDRGSWPLEFRIYRQRLDAPNESDLVVELSSEHSVSRAGVMTLRLPEHVPPLEPGRRYWWQVELRCDPDDASGNVFAEAELGGAIAGNLGNGALGAWLRAKANGTPTTDLAAPDWSHWGLTLAEAQALELGEVSLLTMPSP